MSRFKTVLGCLSMLGAGLTSGACLFGSCPDFQDVDPASLIVLEAPTEPEWPDAAVEIEPGSMTLEYEQDDGSRWRVTYDLTLD
ncbi:MAG: hypothetical protein AAGA54_22885 [Myxococcota bacterium]